MHRRLRTVTSIRTARVYWTVFTALLLAALLAACGDLSKPVSRQVTQTPTAQQAALRPRAVATTATPAPTVTTTDARRMADAPGGPELIQVATGENHTCVLRGDGQVMCWGTNDQGQLDLPKDTRFRQITSGWRFSCGIQTEGTVNCWGRNNHQQADPPVGQFQAVDAGWDHACGLSGATAVCWGRNANERATPPPDVEFTAIGAGAEHSCGLSTAGDLLCWGKNDNSRADSRSGPFQALAVGIAHTCVLDSDGKALCQGDNSAGQSEPPGTAFVKVNAGANHTCGTLASGHVECWGARQSDSDHVPFGPPGRYTSVSSGWLSSCATSHRGQMACWSTVVRPRGPEPYDALILANDYPGLTLSEPTDVVPWPTGELAIADRLGGIVLLTREASIIPILDLTDIVKSDGSEQGLLSIALDPRFKESRFMYLYYTIQDPRDVDRAISRLSRMPIVGDQPLREQELILLEVPRDSAEIGHYGGAIRFGPDGMLYLGIGDAWCFNCPQSLDTLHGKIIRIDVREATLDAPYLIPEDNPMRDSENALPEIWAYGLRNPWRMEFDSEDGRLWVGDVGHLVYEEISIVTRGANLGWPIMEGSHCLKFSEAVRKWYGVSAVMPCKDIRGLSKPIITYEHEGKCAVVGGLVYRGDEIPWLNGTYLLGDYCSGKVWALDGDADSGWRLIEIADLDMPLSSFGTNANGEVLVLTFGGPVLRLVEAESRFAASVTHTPLAVTRMVPSSTIGYSDASR